MDRNLLIPTFTLLLVFASCKKDRNDSPELLLENTVWQPSLTGDNPTTRNYGELILFNLWLECDLDDRLTFKNGKFFVNYNSTCESDKSIFAKYNNSNYSYYPDEKLLVIGDADNALSLQVFEVSKSQLKIGRHIPQSMGVSYLGFIFKRK
jgi:hypothetical protein